ncbi:acyltransferase family protein [Modestobacter sp. I12A-02628]|uniref:Acyltransferase n=1 Tax=Goekera deserti TaxID=2497753 RepID=A0A7K3WAS7_9ACTN|nr:acyltransferase [Goekera deserti]MPR00319.1 acyltransferase family protein [Goekera deserti]NDI49493.1 acyltransferase family protein [Goekera deserti]NEL52633.1 acyltransferase [Goekera deserti]
MTEAPSTDSPLRGEIKALTGLRIVAAVWVVAFHFMFTPGESYRFVWEPWRPLLNTGALGVDLFFVLSGFVITLSYLDKMGARPTVRSFVGFCWARICRVWPVYALVTTLFGGWLVYRAGRVGEGAAAFQAVQPVVDVEHYIEQLLMVQLWDQSAFDGSSWVGPGWSISAEWAAYVCFPLVVLVLWRLRRLPAPVLMTLAVLCLAPIAWRCLTVGDPYYPWSWAVRIGGGFAAGALTCLAVRRLRITPRVQLIGSRVAIAALAQILLGLWWGFQRGGGENNFGGIVVVLFPVLVGALAISRGGLARALGTDALVHGGRISFSLYLVHIPVFEVFRSAMEWYPTVAPGTPLQTLLAPQVFLGSFVLAHLCYRFVEEPSRLWLRDRGPGRWARSAPAADLAVAAPAPALSGEHGRRAGTRTTVPPTLPGPRRHPDLGERVDGDRVLTSAWRATQATGSDSSAA